MSRSSTSTPSNSVAFIVYLVITSLVCGAMVMVIEVLGSRVIGPFFGASLFVWTSLITVTLVGLALGYTAGGLLSDKHESPDVLYSIICLSGVMVLLIPLLKSPVLSVTMDMGLRLGALVTSAALFGPTLFLLGCVSPYLIKIAAREMHTIGKTVGLFYAVSTIGSFVGTVFTGFVLIAYFKVNSIFLFIGSLLILLALLYFVLFRKKAVALVMLLIPLLVPGVTEVHSKVLADGSTVTRVYDSESFYGNIKVLDYIYKEKHQRELLVDGATQGGMDMTNGMSIFAYPYYLQYIPHALNSRGKNCLVVGLGAGIVPMWFEKMGITTDVVDISPDIFRIAETYFGFRTRGEKIVEDARYFLNRPGKKYDYVILDVFNGDNTPVHVLSVETLRQISRRMNEGGIVGINFVGSIKGDVLMTASLVKSLQEVFKTVEIYPVFDPATNDVSFGNLEIIAHNSSAPPLDREKLKQLPFHVSLQHVKEFIGKTYALPAGTPGLILTDDYNPIDFYDLQVKEKVRQGLQQWTDREMLL